jgi:PPIC-type PPIASE domain
MRALLVSFVLLSACASTTGMGGPNMSDRDNPPPASSIQSNDVLSREAATGRSRVQHILVSWKDLAAAFDGAIDPRAKNRTSEEADKLASELLARVRAGEDMTQLMRQFSEDLASAMTGDSYEVTPEAKLVFEFKRMGLRLEVGEAGLVMSKFGWHIMKRVE